MQLKYGMNPNQQFAEVVDNDHLQVLNGRPSMINFLDALNAWPLVKELDEYSGLPSAASFKHVTPSGAAVAADLTEAERLSYNCRKEIESPLAKAYLRARGADRLASFGDFIALSRKVDVETARLVKTEVSDGLIAPDFDPEALEILKGKKKGGYVIMQIDPDYIPPEVEARTVFGCKLRQERNSLKLDDTLLKDIVTAKKDLPEAVKRNILVGMITLKYTNSNSVCLVTNGQAVGIGSGQQSRILCSGLAAGKANRWMQKVLMEPGSVSFPEKCSKTEKDLILDQEREAKYGDRIVLNQLDDLCLVSDAFFPQTDNIKLANDYGVRYIASAMGSIRDQDIIKACDGYGMTFVNTGIRLFHH